MSEETTRLNRSKFVEIGARRAFLILLSITTALTLIGLGVDLLKHRSPDLFGITGAAKLLSLNGEANIPSWYSSLLWLIAAALAWTIAAFRERVDGRFVAHWIGFGVACAYLSLDEAAMIHEAAGNLINRVLTDGRFLELGGGWTYAWMYYGVGLVTVFLIVYRKFLFHLPRGVVFLFIAAGVTYLSGALGVESLSAAAENKKISSISSSTWDVMIAVEEFLEMLGVVLLIHALLTYMRMERVRTGVEVRD